MAFRTEMAKRPQKPRKAEAQAPPEELGRPDDAAGHEDDSAPAPGSGKKLVIVESPAKAKTINKYLGRDFVVRASMGHVRDLPTKKIGVDLEHGFEPTYEPLPTRKKVLTELKKLARAAGEVYLATDLDREGEAIAWHLAQSLGLRKNQRVFRVIFNEITRRRSRRRSRTPTTST